MLTQNFKAEYEKAASSIITAITRSGGNRYSGEIFNFYQDKALVENKAIVRIRNATVSRLLDIVISFNVTTPL